MGLIRDFTPDSTPTRFIFGIDPGTGSRSACGICLLDLEAGEVLWSMSVYPNGRPNPTMLVHHRIKLITEQIVDIFESTVESFPNEKIIVAIESFVMRGKGGETLAQLKGAVMASFPMDIEIKEVQNTTVKKHAGDSGRADKLIIAESLQQKLPKSKHIIEGLIKNKLWDEVDAIGIAWSVAKLLGKVGQ